MEKIDKISKYGNLFFYGLLYTVTIMLAGATIGNHIQYSEQSKRLVAYDWYDGDCFDRVDINWILTGINE
jgi:hypothetical protein